MFKVVPFRRRREGKTDYKKRLALLKSGKTRFCVRKTNKYVIVQFINYFPEGDKVLFTVTSKSLSKFGWKTSFKNTTAIYLTGYLAGKIAKEKGIKEAILDMGMITPKKGIKWYAALKGAKDAGVEIPSSDDIYPSEDRINHDNLEKVKSMIENGN